MATPSPDLAPKVRKFVFDHFLETAAPPVLEQVMVRFGLPRAAASEVLRTLESGRHIKLIPGTARILMAFPFSAVTTPFEVTRRDGRTYYANCSWDAVAFHGMLGEPIGIDAFCHDCGQPMALEVADGRLARSNVEEPLVYLSLPAAQWWDDIVTTCANHMVFFRSREHLEAWGEANPDTSGAALTVEQVHNLGLPIYKDKLKLEYARPSRDILVSHIASLGLTGEFWRI